MQFRAKIRPNSWAHRDWLGRNRTGGVISRVKFHRIGRDFFSVDDPLGTDAVARLMHNNQVILEVTAHAPLEAIVPAPAKAETVPETDDLERQLVDAIAALQQDPQTPEPETEETYQADATEYAAITPMPKRRGRPPKAR